MTEQVDRDKVARLIMLDHLQLLSDFDVDGDIYRKDPECAASAYSTADAIIAALTVTPQENRSLPDRIMVWHSSPTLDHLGTWATTRYPEEAVAYVPEVTEIPATVLDETSLRAVIGEIGNQIHNLACELQGDEDLSERLESFACGLWRVAQSASPESMPAMTPQEAAKVLLNANAHTEKAATYAAAKEFPQMGFINAAAVIGAALRAISEDSHE